MKYIIVLSSVLAALLVACSDQNEKPKATVEVNVKDGHNSVGDAVDNAADKIKDGANEATEKIEDAGDKIKDKLDEAKDKLSDDKKAKVEVHVDK
jgi:Skp family chaperone for outer membrane proteins